MQRDVIADLVAQISLDGSRFDQGMGQVNRQLKTVQEELKTARSRFKQTGDSTDLLGNRSKSLSDKLRLQQARVDLLSRAYNESKENTGEFSARTQRLETQLERARRELSETESELRSVNEQLQVKAWDDFGDSMQNAGDKLQTVGRATTNFGKQWSMRVTAPILGAGALILRTGMDFEASMSKVQALTRGTGEEMQAMSDQAKHLGETTMFSASQAAEGMAFLGMAGWDTSQIIAGMPGLLNLAAAGALDLGRAADITSNIMSGFNISADEAGRVSDVLAEAASSANTNVEQLGEAMKYVAPTANTLGISIEQSTAAIMAVSNAGIQGSMAGRAFSTSLTRLAKPTAAMEKEMKRLGLSFFDAEGKMKTLPDIVQGLEKATKDMTEEQVAATTSILFGAQAQKHWAVLIDQGSESLRKNTENLENSEGAAERMAKTMMDNGRGAMIEFKSAMEGISIALSEYLIPTFTDITRKATDFVRKFGELDDETKRNIITMAGLAAAIGPVAIVLGSMTTAIGGVLKVGGSLVKLIGRSGGAGLAGRIGLLGMSGPVGLAITGVGALAGGIYLLTRDSEKLHDINLDVAKSLNDQHNEASVTAEKYRDLREKSRLTTEQFGKLLDLRHDLAKSPEGNTLKNLEDQYEYLTKKSGLTNEQLDEMIMLNQTIVENAPQTAEAHSKQGNAIADVNEKLDEYLDMLRDMSLEQLALEKSKWAENQVIHQKAINDAKKEQKEIDDKLEILDKNRNLGVDYWQDRLNEIVDLQSNYLTSEEDKIKYAKEETILRALLKGEHHDIWQSLLDQKDEQKEIIENAETEIAKGREIDDLYAEIHLKKLGINASGEEGIEIAEKQLEKLRKQRDGYQKQIDQGGDITGELQEQVDIIGRQIHEHENVLGLLNDQDFLASELIDGEKERERQTRATRQALEDQEAQLRLNNDRIEAGNLKAIILNSTLGKDISKTVNTKTTTDSAFKRLGDTISKRVNVNVGGLGSNAAILGYATGTPAGGHKGGPFIAGEEGWELGRMGNRWEMLGFGAYERPRGYQVFTHDESKKIMSALNNTPGYATGARPPGEANRVISEMNNPNTGQPMILEIHVTSEMDKRAVGKGVARVVLDEHMRITNPKRKGL